MAETTGSRRCGFTLLEFLVVITLIVILAAAVMAGVSVIFKGQKLSQGARQITATLAHAREKAADRRTIHFVVFDNGSDGRDGCSLTICEDTDGDRLYDNDGTDLPLKEGIIRLPDFVRFKTAPKWMAVYPTGYTVFSPDGIGGGPFLDVHAGDFDGHTANCTEPPGDVVIRLADHEQIYCLDIDRAAGKIRRSFFLDPNPAN